MKTTIEYMTEAKKALGIASDYELAKKLGLTKGAVSAYRNGHRTIDDYAAAKIAEALKIDPIEVIAVANMEREKDEKRRDFWRTFCHASPSVIATVFLFFSNAYTAKDAIIDSIVCILC